jgi:orotidine-5'-phosphate decarboxylase
VIPGPGIITGLAGVGAPLGRGLLLMAEMSSKGTLAKAEYTQEALRMARASRTSEGDFVVGFIAMGRIEEVLTGAQEQENADDDFLVLTPGVGLDAKGDGLGQQYRTPHQVVLESGCDVIIVGRGIYASGDVTEMQRQAERYRTAGWDAYLERVSRGQ